MPTLQTSPDRKTGQNLLRCGVLLFLLGLLTGFTMPLMENPRMGLSSHLEGVLNGMFLVLLGLLWPQLALGKGKRTTAGVLAVFGTYANWLTTLLAGLLGVGGEMMPIAGAGYIGTTAQEALISAGLISLSLAMIVVCSIVLWGLRPRGVSHTEI